MRTDDEAKQGSYLVKRLTEPYKLQENTIMKGIYQPLTDFVEEIIFDAVFWNPVPKMHRLVYAYLKILWFLLIRLKQVLQIRLTMMMSDGITKLPSNYNQKRNKFRCNKDRK